MNPLLSIFGSSLLGGLGHLFGGGPHYFSPQQLAQLYGPQALLGDWGNIYRTLQASPQFQNTINQIGLQGSQLSNNIAGGLADRGLTTSGIGTIAERMGQSAGGFAASQARAGLGSTALDIAQQNLLARLGAQVNQPGYPSGIQSFLGSILSSAGPALAQYYAGQQKPTSTQTGTDLRPPTYGLNGSQNPAFGGWGNVGGGGALSGFGWNPYNTGGMQGLWGAFNQGFGGPAGSPWGSNYGGR